MSCLLGWMHDISPTKNHMISMLFVRAIMLWLIGNVTRNSIWYEYCIVTLSKRFDTHLFSPWLLPKYLWYVLSQKKTKGSEYSRESFTRNCDLALVFSSPNIRLRSSFFLPLITSNKRRSESSTSCLPGRSPLAPAGWPPRPDPVYRFLPRPFITRQVWTVTSSFPIVLLFILFRSKFSSSAWMTHEECCP